MKRLFVLPFLLACSSNNPIEPITTDKFSGIYSATKIPQINSTAFILADTLNFKIDSTYTEQLTYRVQLNENVTFTTTTNLNGRYKVNGDIITTHQLKPNESDDILGRLNKDSLMINGFIFIKVR